MTIPYPIAQLQQPDSTTCMVTCLAMLLGMDVEEAVKNYHEGLFSHDCWYDEIFDIHGIPYRYNPATNPGQTTYTQKIYLLGVPSLNVIGGMHQVIFDTRHVNFPTVIDPNKGIPGKKYYTYGDPKNDDEVKMISWNIDLEIISGPIMTEDSL